MRLKWVPGFEGSYKVSYDGAVISFIAGRSRNKTVERKSVVTPNGYLKLNLIKNGKKSGYLVHRLVATAFIKNPQNKPFVNHKNGNKLDNSVDNLEWCTAYENMQHAKDVLKLNISSKPVICLTTGQIFRSQNEAAREFNEWPQKLSNLLCGRVKKLRSGLAFSRYNE